jgi:hypothetical protein
MESISVSRSYAVLDSSENTYETAEITPRVDIHGHPLVKHAPRKSDCGKRHRLLFVEMPNQDGRCSNLPGNLLLLVGVVAPGGSSIDSLAGYHTSFPRISA